MLILDNQKREVILMLGKRLTTAEFIERAKIAHGDKYDYSKVEYTGMYDKVKIICPVHGVFMQTPACHTVDGSRGHPRGCMKCGGKKHKTTNDFIRESKKVHGDKYDYSKVKYVRSVDKIEIVCPEHGAFYQQADLHYSGMGCPACGHEKRGKARSAAAAKNFLAKAKAVHGDKYDYSKVKYKKAKSPVEIICKEHGAFMQKPDAHYMGKGCTQCAESGDYDAIYILKSDQPFQGRVIYKIGVSSWRIKDKRFGQLRIASGFELKPVLHLQVEGNALEIERELLKIGKNPEFTGFDGATEYRAFSDEELEEAMRLAA